MTNKQRTVVHGCLESLDPVCMYMGVPWMTMASIPLRKDIRPWCARVQTLLGFMNPVLCHRRDRPFMKPETVKRRYIYEIDVEHGR